MVPGNCSMVLISISLTMGLGHVAPCQRDSCRFFAVSFLSFSVWSSAVSAGRLSLLFQLLGLKCSPSFGVVLPRVRLQGGLGLPSCAGLALVLLQLSFLPRGGGRVLCPQGSSCQGPGAMTGGGSSVLCLWGDCCLRAFPAVPLLRGLCWGTWAVGTCGMPRVPPRPGAVQSVPTHPPAAVATVGLCRPTWLPFTLSFTG